MGFVYLIRLFSLALSFVLSSSALLYSLHGGEHVIALGGSSPWPAFAVNQGVKASAKGSNSAPLTLDYSYSPQNTDAELSLNFDDGTTISPHYKVTSPGRISHDHFYKGGASLVFPLGGKAFKFRGDSKTLFFPGKDVADFALQFFFKSTTLGEGEELFDWQAGKKLGEGGFELQTITCMVDNRRLVWEFRNFFADGKTFVVKSEPLIPQKWYHNQVTYNADTGQLELFINNRSADVVFTTPSHHEETDIYTPTIGTLSEGTINLGSSFVGFIDEFKIFPIFHPAIDMKRFVGAGVVRTGALNLTSPASTLDQIIVNGKKEDEQDYVVSYAFAKSPGEAKNIKSSDFLRLPPSGVLSRHNIGQYLVLKIDLYASYDRLFTPEVQSLRISYYTPVPPSQPTDLAVTHLGGNVLLSWNSEPDLGVRVYFSANPSNFFISARNSNLSGPIVVDPGVTRYLFTNLQKGKRYFFAVQSLKTYSSGVSVASALTPEVFIIP